MALTGSYEEWLKSNKSPEIAPVPTPTVIRQQQIRQQTPPATQYEQVSRGGVPWPTIQPNLPTGGLRGGTGQEQLFGMPSFFNWQMRPERLGRGGMLPHGPNPNWWTPPPMGAGAGAATQQARPYQPGDPWVDPHLTWGNIKPAIYDFTVNEPLYEDLDSYPGGGTGSGGYTYNFGGGGTPSSNIRYYGTGLINWRV